MKSTVEMTLTHVIAEPVFWKQITRIWYIPCVKQTWTTYKLRNITLNLPNKHI
jgi:hypothetical protein